MLKESAHRFYRRRGGVGLQGDSCERREPPGTGKQEVPPPPRYGCTGSTLSFSLAKRRDSRVEGTAVRKDQAL